MREKRKAYVLMFAVVFFLAVCSKVWSAVTVTVDGQVLALEQPAIMAYGRVMVPLRGIFEALGASVSYNPTTRSIVAARAETVVTLGINSRAALINGTTIDLDAPPMVIGGRVLVPLRFVSEAMGAEVKWTASSETVSILSSTGGASLSLPAPYSTSGAQSGSIIPLSLFSPNPASNVSQTFDVTGSTQPNALVRLRVVADKAFIGMIFGVHHDEIVSTSATADAKGNYHFRVDTGSLAAGTHMVMTLEAENSLGAFSRQLRVELTRI